MIYDTNKVINDCVVMIFNFSMNYNYSQIESKIKIQLFYFEIAFYHKAIHIFMFKIYKTLAYYIIVLPYQFIMLFFSHQQIL